MVKKILIIKLGALGDVIRTLSILPAIKEKYPDSEIYWLTKPESKEIVTRSPYVKAVYTLPYKEKEDFDILYNFDIDKVAAELSNKIKAGERYGFSLENNYPVAYNSGAEYYLNTLFDDELKRKNKKTYQEMMFETAELPYNNEHHPLYLSGEDNKHALSFVKKNKIITKNLLGIHIGASSRWPSKIWSEEKIIEFIIKAKRAGYNVILFAGKEEENKQEKIISILREQGIDIYKNNPNNSFWEFVSLVNLCDKIICSDSMSLHVALALKKPTVCLFFCTSPQEIEGYGILTKVISPLLYEFFPEKMDQYDEKLVNSISSDEVIKALNNNK